MAIHPDLNITNITNTIILKKLCSEMYSKCWSVPLRIYWALGIKFMLDVIYCVKCDKQTWWNFFQKISCP